MSPFPCPPLAVILLAQGDRVSDLGNRFKPGGANLSYGHLVMLGLLIVVIAMIVWALARFFAAKEGRGYYNAQRLFRELCRAHGLDWPSRRLLGRLARAQHLAQPARMFMEPDRFDPESLEESLMPHREQLALVRDRIFYGTDE